MLVNSSQHVTAWTTRSGWEAVDPSTPPSTVDPFLRSFWGFKIDDKGRASVPAAYREVLRARHGGEAVVLTISPDRCLNGHAAACWPEMVQASRRWLDAGPNAAAFQRLYVATAEIVEPDQHGRTRIPARLHAFAGLRRDVHFVGVGTHFELWDRERFEAFQGSIDLDAMRGLFAEVVGRYPA